MDSAAEDQPARVPNALEVPAEKGDGEHACRGDSGKRPFRSAQHIDLQNSNSRWSCTTSTRSCARAERSAVGAISWIVRALARFSAQGAIRRKLGPRHTSLGDERAHRASAACT